MKSCPVCDESYVDDSAFCSKDGVILVNTSCRRCGDLLQRGFLFHPQVKGFGGDMRGLTWIEGDSPDESITSVRDRNAIQYRVTTYRCRKCGYIELYALEPQDGFSF